MVCAVALLAASCADDGSPTGSDGASQSAAPAGFMDEVEALCAPVLEQYGAYEGAETAEDIREFSDGLAEAERDLVEGLRTLDAPPDIEEDFDAYVDALEESSQARRTGEGATKEESLEGLVASTKAEIRMDDIATGAGLPDECPPPASYDLDNTLFVARANLECFRLLEDAGGEQFDPPQTATEVALTLDLARRVTVGIAKAVKRSAPSGVLDMPLKKIVWLSKRRFQAINALEETFESGDYRAYREAGPKLMKVSRKIHRELLSLGLVYCAQAFNVIPL